MPQRAEIDATNEQVCRILREGMRVPASDKQSDKNAWLGWMALFLVTAALIIAGSNRSVVSAYRTAAVNWFAGHGLYDGSGVGGFVYFPQAAILFAPFAMIPQAMAEVLWRLVNTGVFALGLRSFAWLGHERSGKTFFPLMTLVAIPLAWDCAKNGQATLIMAGFMLLAIADIARCRWWRAVLWLSLSVAMKPLAIVLVLLVMAIDRPMTWRLVLGMAALALAPFLTQSPAYVLQQYAAFLHNSTTAAHVGVVVQGWTSPFSALRLVGVELTEQVQMAVRIAAAFGTLALCFLARRRYDANRSAIYVYSMAALYLILFSPRTENNTYAMLGPSIAVFLSLAFLAEKRLGQGLFLAGMVAVLIGSRPIDKALTPHAEAFWVSPLIATCFAAYLFFRLYTEPAQGSESQAIAMTAAASDTTGV